MLKVFHFYITCKPPEPNDTALIINSFRSSEFNRGDHQGPRRLHQGPRRLQPGRPVTVVEACRRPRRHDAPRGGEPPEDVRAHGLIPAARTAQ
jgi:hypothetical protein